jgi:signal transduction histidine kinase
MVFFIGQRINKSKQYLLTMFILIFIVFSAGYVISDNWDNSKVNLLANIYNMGGSIIIGTCFLSQYIRLKKNKANSYTLALPIVGCGFVLWGIIQLLIPIGNFFEWSDMFIQILGFSISTISKFLILFGIYIYVINSPTHELLQKGKLESLQDLIYEISNLKDSNSIAKKVTKHLTSKNDIFDYDYAIFSDVDHLKQKIVYKECTCENLKISSPEEWVGKERVSFNDSDIMVHVLKERRPYFVDNRYFSVDEWKTYKDDTQQFQPILNENVYETYNHKYLNRILVPVFSSRNKKEGSDNDDRVVAILEFGHYEPNLRNRPIKKTIYNEGILRLYLDFVAQTYVRVFSKEIEDEINGYIKKADESNIDDPNSFLKDTFDRIFNCLNVEFGIFSCLKENKELLELYSNLPSNFSREDYLSSEKKSKYEISFKSDAIQLSLLLLKNTPQDEYFFDIINKPLSGKLQDILLGYEEKRYHQYLGSLAIPNRAVIEIDANLKSQIESLQEFLKSSSINIWIKDGGSITRRYYSDELETLSYSINEININEINIPHEDTIFQINNFKEKNNPFVEIGEKQNMSSLIYLPLKLQNGLAGIINIYFKKRVFMSIDELSIEERSILNIFSTKLIFTLQMNKLISSFRNITDTFAKNDLKLTLRNITEQASELLNADPVFLYISHKGKDVFYSDVSHSIKTPLHDATIVKSIEQYKNNHVELAEYIIKDETQYFDDENDYNKYISQKKRQNNSESDFWHREGIKSMAAIRLTKGDIKNTAIGVLFINYREFVPIKNNEEVKRIMDAFAFLASGCISNAMKFEENKLLSLRKMNLIETLGKSVLISGTLHDAKKSFDTICIAYDNLIAFLNDQIENNKKDLKDIRAKIEKKLPLYSELYTLLSKFDEYYRRNYKPNFIETKISDIIEGKVQSINDVYHEMLIRIEGNYLNSDVKIECDVDYLGIAVLNIIDNAYQAMEKRGTIEIVIDDKNGESVRINISNDGKEINEAIYSSIKEPGVTDKDQGSGYGLAMSSFIIEQVHRGHLEYKSNSKKTTFTIILPYKIKNEDR